MNLAVNAHSTLESDRSKMSTDVAWRFLLICVIGMALKVQEVKSSADIMKKMTIGFSKALEQCKKEINLGDHVMQDFYNFWKEDYELLNSEVGCAIMCMAGKLNLINEENKLHHKNAHEFARNHGADDEMAQQLVTIIHECEKVNAGETDECKQYLEVAKCFRTKIHGLKWAPDMETVLEEVMTEVKA